MGHGTTSRWIAASASLSRERVERILAGYERFNRGELDEALVGFSDDVEWVAPPQFLEPGPFKGPAGVRRFWDTWLETFQDFRIEIEEVHDLEDHVVVIARVHGTGRDSGADVATPSFPHVWTFRGDEIVRMEMSEEAAREVLGRNWH